MMMNSRTLFGLLLGVIIALCIIPRQTKAASCNYTKNAPPNTRPLPNLFGDTFKAYSVQIQMNYISKKQIIWGEEYYDQTQSKAFMTYTMNGSRFDYIMNYQDKYIVQAVTFPDGGSLCQINPLVSSAPNDNFHFFGKVKVSGGGTHPYPIGQIFDMGEPEKFSYQDDSPEIDGVDVDHWHACLNWPEDNDVFKLDYYFSTIDWNGLDYQYPVQATVTGEKTLKNDTTISIDILYEYFNFVPAVSLEPGIFDIPSNVQCQDDNNLVTRDIPALPSKYKLTIQTEVIDIASNTMTTKDYIYDPVNKMILTMQGMTKSIDDFNTNVHYGITFKKYSTECRIIEITAGQFTSANSNKLRMKTPDELLFIDDKDQFEYLGTLYDRSLRADIWMLHNQKITYVHEASKGNPPLPLSVISLTTRVNVIDFRFNRTHDIGNGDPFDITPCKSEPQLKNIRITFVANEYSLSTKSLLKEGIVFKAHEAIQTAVAQALHVSPSHVHWIHMFASDREAEIYWDAVLVGPDLKELPAFPYKNVSDVFYHLKTTIDSQVLQVDLQADNYGYNKPTVIASRVDDLSNIYNTAVSKTGPLSKFTKYTNKRPYVTTWGVKTTATTADNCASLCVDEQTFECRSFAFCSSTKECLRENKFRYGIDLTDSTQCDYYSRQYTADFYQEPGYFLKPRKALLYENLADDNDCASMCLAETTLFCKSFTYCAESAECFVEQSRSTERYKDQKTDKPVCQHYYRQAIAEYTASINTAVTSIDRNNPLERVDGDSPEGCALKCGAKRSVDGCGQFDYCPSTKECHFVSDAVRKYAAVVNSALCTTYTWKKASSGQSTSAQSASSNNSYGGGSMAALGIIMALIGVALGCVGFFFLSRRQGWTVR